MNGLLLAEVASALLGVMGALLLATKSRWAPWAWVLWLASNAGWIAFGLAGGHWFLLAQNAVFAVTSAMGVWVWLVRPARLQKGGSQ